MTTLTFSAAIGLLACRHSSRHADAAEVAAKIARLSEAEDGRPVVVDCGKGVLVFTDEGVPCTLTDASGTVAITVTHSATELRWSPADAPALERDLRIQGEKAIGPVEAIHCDPAAVKPGATVSCTIAYQGGAASPVHIAIEADGSSHVTYDQPIINLDKVAQQTSTSLSKQAHQTVAVDCGAGIIVMPSDGVRCTTTATVGTQHGAFTVTFGPNGALAFTPVEAL